MSGFLHCKEHNIIMFQRVIVRKQTKLIPCSDNDNDDGNGNDGDSGSDRTMTMIIRIVIIIIVVVVVFFVVEYKEFRILLPESEACWKAHASYSALQRITHTCTYRIRESNLSFRGCKLRNSFIPFLHCISQEIDQYNHTTYTNYRSQRLIPCKT